MKNKRLDLRSLEVKSFVTLASEDAKGALKGGGCTNLCTFLCNNMPNRTVDQQDCCIP